MASTATEHAATARPWAARVATRSRRRRAALARCWLLLLAACGEAPEVARPPDAAPAPGDGAPGTIVQYRGEPQHRGIAPEGSHLGAPLRRIWRTPALGLGGYTASKSSPAVDEDTVYVGEDDGRLYALDRETGELRWTFATRRHLEESLEPPADGAYTGIHGSPACDAERVYIGDYAGWLYAVDKRSGQLEWEQELGGSIGASPTLGADRLTIAVEVPTPDGRVFALRPDTGALTFVSDWLGHHPHASVSWLDGALFAGSNAGALVRFDPPGRRASFAAGTGGAIKATAALADDGDVPTAYVTSGDGGLYAVDARSGRIRFSFPTAAMSMSSPAVAAGRVVFGSHDGFVRCVVEDSGLFAWSFAAGAAVASSPTIVLDDRLVLVGTNAGDLLGLDLDTGEERLRVTLDAPVTSVPVVAGASLFVNDDSGTVTRFDGT